MCQALDPNPGKSAVNENMNTAANLEPYSNERREKGKNKELNGTLKNIVGKG